MQEIWLAVWQALPRFRNECSERTFLFRIAHNRAVTHVDHWSRRRTDVLEDDAPIVSPGRTRSTRCRSSSVRNACATRSSRCRSRLRQVVVLTLEGLSNAEVAEVVGISENNVAVRLTRARAALSRALNPGSQVS